MSHDELDPLEDPRVRRLVAREATTELSVHERAELEVISARAPSVLAAREREARLSRALAAAARPEVSSGLDVARLARSLDRARRPSLGAAWARRALVPAVGLAAIALVVLATRGLVDGRRDRPPAALEGRGLLGAPVPPLHAPVEIDVADVDPDDDAPLPSIRL